MLGSLENEEIKHAAFETSHCDIPYHLSAEDTLRMHSDYHRIHTA